MKGALHLRKRKRKLQVLKEINSQKYPAFSEEDMASSCEDGVLAPVAKDWIMQSTG